MFDTKVIVTGGAGFVGANLVNSLVRKGGNEVHVVDIFMGEKRADRINSRATYHNIDIHNVPAVKEVFDGADIVFHLAGMTGVPRSLEQPLETLWTNAGGTATALEAARQARVGKFIYMASSSAYGDQKETLLREDLVPAPLSPYALSKRVGEEGCRQWTLNYGLKTVCPRFFSIYGPLQGPEGSGLPVVLSFLQKKQRGEPLTVAGTGSQRRDLIHVDDVVGALLRIADSSDVGDAEIINIGSGRNYSILELAEMFDAPITFTPQPPLEVATSLADIRKAESLLGWTPKVSLQDGITDLLKRARLH